MKWRVKAYRGKRHEIDLGCTYVRADDAETAERIAREVMRVRIRGGFRVQAVRYYPEYDIAMRRFVREVP